MQNHQADSKLCVAWCLIWWFASLSKVWSYMAPNVLTETRYVSLNNTQPTNLGLTGKEWISRRVIQLTFTVLHSNVGLATLRHCSEALWSSFSSSMSYTEVFLESAWGLILIVLWVVWAHSSGTFLTKYWYFFLPVNNKLPKMKKKSYS